MCNSYLSTVSNELNDGISSLRNLKATLDEFLVDLPNVEGLNGLSPIQLVLKAQKSVDEALFQLGLVNDFVKEAIIDG